MGMSTVEFYLPRCDVEQASARVGAGQQADVASAELEVVTPDGVRHRISVALYASAIHDRRLILDVLTEGTTRYDVAVVVNDDDAAASIVAAEGE